MRNGDLVISHAQGCPQRIFGSPNPCICLARSVVTEARETRVTSSTGGQKGTKIQRYDLIPAVALRELAEHYGKGAEKYPAVNGRDNWRNGYDWSLSFAAMMRHAWAWWAGEDFDEETGSTHLAAVAWHAFTLRTFMDEQPGFDNRPKDPPEPTV